MSAGEAVRAGYNIAAEDGLHPGYAGIGLGSPERVLSHGDARLIHPLVVGKKSIDNEHIGSNSFIRLHQRLCRLEMPGKKEIGNDADLRPIGNGCGSRFQNE